MPSEAAAVLRDAGHDAVSVIEQNLGGHLDNTIARVCQAEARAILTLDLDFADIRIYPPRAYAGIIVLRPARQDKHLVLSIVRALVPHLQSETVVGRLWIADEVSVRIRGEASEG